MAYFEEDFSGQTDATGAATINLGPLIEKHVYFLGYVVVSVGGGQGCTATITTKAGFPLAAAAGLVPSAGPFNLGPGDHKLLQITGGPANAQIQGNIIGDVSETIEGLLVRPQPTQAGQAVTGPQFPQITVTGPADLQGGVQVEGNAKFKGPDPWFDAQHPAYSGGADPTGARGSSAPIQAATGAAGAAGGIVLLAPGTFNFDATVNPASGVTYLGGGQGATILHAAAGLGAPMFSITIAAGGLVSNLYWRDLTIDGNTGPAGTIDGILIDTTANVNIQYRSLGAERVTFRNCRQGARHVANNNFGGAMTNGCSWTYCRFETCAWGLVYGGSYGEWIDHVYCAGCTIWGVCVPGAPFDANPPGPAPSGPTTITTISTLEVEGLGNYIAGTDGGVNLSLSHSRASNIFVSNTSRSGLSFVAAEVDLENLITNVNLWGCGGGLSLWGVNATQCGGSIVNLNIFGAGQNTANWPGGFAERQYPINDEGGEWFIDGGFCRLSGMAVTPAHAIIVGGAINTCGFLKISRVGFDTFGGALFSIGDANCQFSMIDCPGWNPESTQQTIPYAAAITPDYSKGRWIIVGVLTGGITINYPTKPTGFGQKALYLFTQDGAGGHVAAWNGFFNGPPALNAGAGAQTMLEFTQDNGGGFHAVKIF
jgi:hypothetical protein